jgi:Bacterial type II and III secretion system protein
MDRRRFSQGLLAVGLATQAKAARALDIPTKQVMIDARLLIVAETEDTGFGIDLTQKFPSYLPSDDGKIGITLGESIGNHFEDREIFDGLRIEFDARRPSISDLTRGLKQRTQISAPNITKLMDGATPAGRIRLANDTLIHQADPTTYNSVSTMIMVKADETVVIGGLIRARKRRAGLNLPNLSKLPVIGEVFRTAEQSNNRRNLIVFITPKIVR